MPSWREVQRSRWQRERKSREGWRMTKIRLVTSDPPQLSETLHHQALSALWWQRITDADKVSAVRQKDPHWKLWRRKMRQSSLESQSGLFVGSRFHSAGWCCSVREASLALVSEYTPGLQMLESSWQNRQSQRELYRPGQGERKPCPVNHSGLPGTWLGSGERMGGAGEESDSFIQQAVAQL